MMNIGTHGHGSCTCSYSSSPPSPSACYQFQASSTVAPASSIRSRAYRSVAEDYRQSYVTASARVHKAIRGGDYAWLPELVTDNAMLWEANSSGWTAVHYAAASHFLPEEWWEWILHGANAARGGEGYANGLECRNGVKMSSKQMNNRFLTCRNVVGQTVVDVFFRSFLSPLPWKSPQVKAQSKFLLQAIGEVCSDRTLISEVKQRVDERLEERWQRHERQLECISFQSFHQQHERRLDSSVEMSTRGTSVIERCVDFWISLDLLYRAATATNSVTWLHRRTVGSDQHGIVSFLAETGSCPEQIARLALALYPEQAKETMPDGCLPLHLWARSRSYCHDDDGNHIDGMLGPLLQLHPEAATIPDAAGQLPLHIALKSGKSWSQVIPLFQAEPAILRRTDSLTRLFAAGLAATDSASFDANGEDDRVDQAQCTCKGTSACRSNHDRLNRTAVKVRARQRAAGDKGLVSLWNFVSADSQRLALVKAAEQLDTERLTTIYQVLRALPAQLPHS